jgi:leader peptidase (prepilin peptidase)/N-methyltransferase
VELVVGGASLAAYLRHGVGLEYILEFGFVAAMVALVFIDYDHRILPNVITLPGAVLGIALAWPREIITVKDSVLGALLGAGLLLLVAEVYLRIRKIEGLGMGDVKMMGMIGAFLGWKGVLLTLFLGSLLGTLVGLLVMAVKRKGLKTALPFGTFLGVATVVTLFAGPPLLDWYTGLF